MGHDVAHRDRFSLAPRNLEIEVLIHVGIQIDLALLDELHHCSPREELRRRTDPEHGPLRIDRPTCRDIRVAISFFEEHSTVFHHNHHGPGDIAAF